MRRCRCFKLQPWSMKSLASQSSSSGWDGGSPCRPKSLGVRTSASPKCQPQTRLTRTRAVRGLSAAVNQVASAARRFSGEPLVAGKTVTGFANCEEDFADQAVWDAGALARDKHAMPWRIEDELKQLGANFIQAGLWKGFAIRDGNLVTGQQNFSGTETAELMIQTLGH